MDVSFSFDFFLVVCDFQTDGGFFFYGLTYGSTYLCFISLRMSQFVFVWSLLLGFVEYWLMLRVELCEVMNVGSYE